MVMLKMVAKDQMAWLCLIFVLGNYDRVFCHSNHASDDGSIIRFIFHNTLATAAMLLLALRVALYLAELYSLRRGADAIAKVKGIGSEATLWKRALLRGILLLAIGLSAVAAFLAIAIFQDGCATKLHGARCPLAVVLMVVMAIVHGFFTWVVVCKN